ncbi:Sec1-like protein [Blastocladiella britannica]|nr:Sec1-like protein [Blastocladiella britannica]
MKVLLLDQHTTPLVSAVFSQSRLLAADVYLVDRIDNPAPRDRMAHLKCVCFVRPTPESLALLAAELRSPKYAEYHLYFSNVVKKMALEKLAEADVHERVRDVVEVFLDFTAITPALYALDMDPAAWPVYAGSLADWDPNSLQRTVDALVATCLALRRRPVIRYAGASPLAKRLAHEMAFATGSGNGEPGLFDGPGSVRGPNSLAPATLLLLDRRSDPTTPLLAQWTYQAMVHELIGIDRGIVDLAHVDGIAADLKQVPLAAHDDRFYAQHLHSNFGDLGFAIKRYLDEYQSKTAAHATFESIADMKKFVDAYPEVRKLAGNVAKHVALTSELSRVVDAYGLLKVSEAEQNVACDPRDQTEGVWAVLRDDTVPVDLKVKLVALLALRDPRSPTMAAMAQHLASPAGGGASAPQLALIDCLVKYGLPDGPGGSGAGTAVAASGSSVSGAGGAAASADVLLDKTRMLGKSVFRGLKGVENVYTQHAPKMHATLEALVRGKLKEAQFPFVDPVAASASGFSGAGPGGNATARAADVIVFVIGGCTYEEARFAAQLSAATPGVRIVVGGHTVLNSQSFMKQVHDTFAYRISPM